jgi:hypothetical protein
MSLFGVAQAHDPQNRLSRIRRARKSPLPTGPRTRSSESHIAGKEWASENLAWLGDDSRRSRPAAKVRAYSAGEDTGKMCT